MKDNTISVKHFEPDVYPDDVAVAPVMIEEAGNEQSRGYFTSAD